MTHDEQVEAIQEVADEIGGEVYEGYSGRCMYGEKCYGIVCDNVNECIEEASSRGIRGARSDNMGLQYIVYWPSIKDR